MKAWICWRALRAIALCGCPWRKCIPMPISVDFKLVSNWNRQDSVYTAGYTNTPLAHSSQIQRTWVLLMTSKMSLAYAIGPCHPKRPVPMCVPIPAAAISLQNWTCSGWSHCDAVPSTARDWIVLSPPLTASVDFGCIVFALCMLV